MEQDRKDSGGLNNTLLFLSRNALRAGRLFASPFAWPLFITIGALVFFTTIIMIFFLGGAGQASEVQPTAAPTQNISNLINITGATDSQTKIITEALNLALSYPLYKKLLTDKGVVNVSFVPSLPGPYENADALVLGADEIKIREGLPIEKLRYFFLHETGHIIIFRNAGVFSSYRAVLPQLRNNDTPCYSLLGYLTSYPFAYTGGGGDPDVEAFAESVSQYLIYNEAFGLKDFPNRCRGTYEWFRENVFEGRATTNEL